MFKLFILYDGATFGQLIMLQDFHAIKTIKNNLRVGKVIIELLFTTNIMNGFYIKIINILSRI
jgi:hypothetical protein